MWATSTSAQPGTRTHLPSPRAEGCGHSTTASMSHNGISLTSNGRSVVPPQHATREDAATQLPKVGGPSKSSWHACISTNATKFASHHHGITIVTGLCMCGSSELCRLTAPEGSLRFGELFLVLCRYLVQRGVRWSCIGCFVNIVCILANVLRPAHALTCCVLVPHRLFNGRIERTQANKATGSSFPGILHKTGCRSKPASSSPPTTGEAYVHR